jgi:hypothetical protein
VSGDRNIRCGAVEHTSQSTLITTLFICVAISGTRASFLLVVHLFDRATTSTMVSANKKKNQRRNKKGQPPGDMIGRHVTASNRKKLKCCPKLKYRGKATDFNPSHRQIATLISKSLHPRIQKNFVDLVSSSIAASRDITPATTTPSDPVVLISKTPVHVIEEAYCKACCSATFLEDDTSRLVITSCTPADMMSQPLSAYIAEITVNRKCRNKQRSLRPKNESIFGESMIVVPICGSRAEEQEAFDYAYRTFIMVLPSASVFYSLRHATLKDSPVLAPIPTSWLRLIRSSGKPASGSFAKKIHHVWSVDTTPSMKNDKEEVRRNITVLPAFQFEDEYSYSPLLAPDVYIDNKKEVHAKGDMLALRQRYRDELAKSKSNKVNCRRYVKGAVHQHLPSTCYILDIRKEGDVALHIVLHNSESRVESESVVHIRSATHHTKFLETAQEAGASLVKHGLKGNCRLNTNDKGGMYAIGNMLNASGEEFTTKVTEEAPGLKALLPGLYRESSILAHELFPHVLSAIVGTEELGGPTHPAEIGEPPSGMLTASIDLGNATHYDIGDASYGYSVWTESKESTASNWYFMLPNVLLKISGVTYQGVAVQLFHGIAIAWDGRVIRHGTSLTTCGPENHTFGWFLSANGRMVSHLLPNLDEVASQQPPHPIPTLPNNSEVSSGDTLPAIPRRTLQPTSSSLIDTSTS